MLNDRIAAKTLLSLILCSGALLTAAQGCQTKKDSGSNVTFDWDHDLGDVSTTPSTPPNSGGGDGGKIDGAFCHNQKPGSCLSLILRVPKADMVQDLGLSTLALGASSKGMLARLHEACQAAWADYRQKYQADSLRPLRRRLVNNVEKMRCLYLFSSEEAVTETTKLADNEIGLSVRLTKFTMAGTATSGEVRNVGVQIKDTESTLQFRSTAIFGGNEVAGPSSGWQLIGELGAAPLSVKQKLNRDIHWQVDLAALAKNLGKIPTNANGAAASVAAFYAHAKDLVSQVSAAGNPAAASVLLVGMGYNAYRSVCGEDAAACKYSSTTTDSMAAVNHELADLVPSTDTNELFRLAVIRSVQGVLDQVLVGTSPTLLNDKFGI